MTLSSLRKFFAPIQKRILNIVARGVIKAVSEDKALQRFQMTLLAEETFDNLQVVGNYGFASSPKPGAEGVVLFPGGDRSLGLVIGTEDRRYRIKFLAPGEVAIYDSLGQWVHIKDTGVIEVKANAKVLATTPLFETTGNAKVGGALEVVGASTLTGPVAAGATVTAVGVVSGSTIASVTGGGGIADLGGLIDTLRDTYNIHTHPENGTGGGTTSAPSQTVP